MPGTVSNTYTPVTWAQLCANHKQHIGCSITCNMSCAMWCGDTAQLSSLTELKSHLVVVQLYFTNCNCKLMKEEMKPEYQEKIPDDKFLKMPHTKAQKIKLQPRLEPSLWQWWQVLDSTAEALTISPRITPD